MQFMYIGLEICWALGPRMILRCLCSQRYVVRFDKYVKKRMSLLEPGNVNFLDVRRPAYLQTLTEFGPNGPVH